MGTILVGSAQRMRLFLIFSSIVLLLCLFGVRLVLPWVALLDLHVLHNTSGGLLNDYHSVQTCMLFVLPPFVGQSRSCVIVLALKGNLFPLQWKWYVTYVSLCVNGQGFKSRRIRQCWRKGQSVYNRWRWLRMRR